MSNKIHTLIYLHKSFFVTIQTFFNIHRLHYHSPGRSAKYRHYVFEEYARMCEQGGAGKSSALKNAMDEEQWYISAVVIGYAHHVEADMKILLIY